jgi:PIN domain nuclease of toxin-antitoxin system
VSSYIVDSSALLAAILQEDGGLEAIREMGEESLVSTVNLVEVVSKLQDASWTEDEIDAALERVPIEVAPFTESQALDAGFIRNLTRSSGLSLGDRSCFALARERMLPVLTGDRQWVKVDVGVEVRLIR